MTGDRSGRRGLADLLDLHEGRFPVPLLDDAGVRALLATRPRIALVGASARPERPSFAVLRDLRAFGYDVVAVSPAETSILGLPCYPTLADAVAATGPVQLVDVFRRPDACATHAREAVEAGAACLWLQLGIASREAAEIARAGGLDVVMDRCTAIEHVRFFGV